VQVSLVAVEAAKVEAVQGLEVLIFGLRVSYLAPAVALVPQLSQLRVSYLAPAVVLVPQLSQLQVSLFHDN